MAKNLFLICFFLFRSITAISQNATETKQIENVIVRFFDGLSALDDTKIRAEVTETFSLLENGEVWTVDSLIKVLNPLKKGSFTRVNRFNFLRSTRRKQTAWVSYENFAEMNINGRARKVKWLESAVLIKEKNIWKIDMMHSTVLK